jgi:hypothetical protein
MERFNLKKLNKVEGKERYRAEVSNRFAAFKDLNAEEDIISPCETVRENINISTIESLGYHEFKKHEPQFDDGCSKLVDRKKQAKFQRLQVAKEVNGVNLKLHGLSSRANYTDRETASCWRSDCQLLQIEGATWSV